MFFRIGKPIAVKYGFSSILEKIVIFARNFEYGRKIENVKRYNLWYGNTIDSGFPRPLYKWHMQI